MRHREIGDVQLYQLQTLGLLSFQPRSEFFVRFFICLSVDTYRTIMERCTADSLPDNMSSCEPMMHSNKNNQLLR